MAGRSRHSDSPAPPPPAPTWAGWAVVDAIRAYCYAEGLSQQVADGMVRSVLREQANAERQEWRESRPVASERDSSPVG